MKSIKITKDMMDELDYEIKFPEITRTLTDYEVGFRDGLKEAFALYKSISGFKQENN